MKIIEMLLTLKQAIATNSINTPVSNGQVNTDTPEINAAKNSIVSAMNGEVMCYGYTFSPELMGYLNGVEITSLMTLRNTLIETLKTITGSRIKHHILFKDFPYSTPESEAHFFNTMYGHLQNILGYNVQHGMRLSCGHIMDTSMFPVSEYSACPLCGQVCDELNTPIDATVRTPVHNRSLKAISLMTEDKLGAYIGDLLGTTGSLNPQEQAFIKEMIKMKSDPATQTLVPKITLPEKIQKEVLPYVYDLNGREEFMKRANSITDILRLATYKSKTPGDLSLSEKSKYQYSNKTKRELLKILNRYCEKNPHSVLEDMLRHKEKWKRLGEILHPTTKENTQRYPHIAENFNTLRNNEKSIQTFNRTMEKEMKNPIYTPNLVLHMAKRPGEFLRKLDALLRKGSDTMLVHAMLESLVAEKATTMMILNVVKHLKYRLNQAKKNRLFILKGVNNKIKMIDDTRAPINKNDINRAIAILENELIRRFSLLEPMGKVYIDPVLNGIPIPMNRRGDSESMTPIIKGGHYPMPEADFLRIFCYWKYSCDIDLSAGFYDNAFNQIGTISYYNLTSRNINAKHSGDIRNGSKGASEFIDIDINSAIKQNVRYIQITVNNFSGHSMKETNCFTGYMAIDSLSNAGLYEPANVEMKFASNQEGNLVSPLIFDLQRKIVIFADLSKQGGLANNYSNQNSAFQEMMKAMLEIPDRKPTFGDLLLIQATARGEIVEKAEDADIIFSLENFDLETLMHYTE